MNVLLVNGLWSTPAIFNQWKPVFEGAGHRVVNFDPAKCTSFHEATLRLTGMIAELSECALIGHSFGGLLAREASAFSSRVTHLALIAPAAANPLRVPFKSAIKTLRPEYLKMILGKKGKEEFVPSPADCEALFGRKLPVECIATSPGSLVRSIFQFHRISKPQTDRRLLITGMDDPSCGPATQKWATFQGFMHWALPCTDHYPMLPPLDNPAGINQHVGVAERIIRWLKAKA